ncbi:MAG: response regulator [Opitutaceae bacterium]
MGDPLELAAVRAEGGVALDPILIVADSEQEALLLKVALRVAGVQTRLVFTTGHTETVDYFCRVTEYADPTLYPLPRIVLLYTQILAQSGVDLIKQINRTSKDLAIAVVAGSAAENHIENAYASGASCYLRKPEKPDDLVELLRNFRSFWLETKR